MTNSLPIVQTGDQFQRFEFVNEKSSKFWEIRVNANAVDVQYGKIGTKGQALAKEFADEATANKHRDKLVAEKQKEGYAIAGSAQLVAAPAPSPIAVKAAKPKEVPVESPSKSAKPAATSTAKTLCISGKLLSGKKKADYEAPLRAVGIELVDDVIQGLAYLVLADPTSVSSKAVKAKKMGVEVISEDQLVALIG